MTDYRAWTREVRREARERLRELQRERLARRGGAPALEEESTPAVPAALPMAVSRRSLDMLVRREETKDAPANEVSAMETSGPVACETAEPAGDLAEGPTIFISARARAAVDPASGLVDEAPQALAPEPESTPLGDEVGCEDEVEDLHGPVTEDACSSEEASEPPGPEVVEDAPAPVEESCSEAAPEEPSCPDEPAIPVLAESAEATEMQDLAEDLDTPWSAAPEDPAAPEPEATLLGAQEGPESTAQDLPDEGDGKTDQPLLSEAAPETTFLETSDPIDPDDSEDAELARAMAAAAASSGPPMPEADAVVSNDLAHLPGAGAGLVWMLGQCGIHSLGDLAHADAGRLRDDLGLVGRLLDLEGWIAFARQQVPGAA